MGTCLLYTSPKDTRTGCQKKALEKYVKDFHRRFPDVRIVGHNELAAKALSLIHISPAGFKVEATDKGVKISAGTNSGNQKTGTLTLTLLSLIHI